MMRRSAIVAVAALVLITGMAPVFGQETNRAVQAYIDRFRDATVEVKLNILQTADMASVQELGPLYVVAVQFALNNASRLESDVTVQRIAEFAVDRIEEGAHRPAVASLWSLFTVWRNNAGRISILTALRVIGPGSAQLVVDLNAWVASQTNLSRGGTAIDLQVFRNALLTLEELGDASSFPVFLDVRTAQISATISQDAVRAMKSLPGDYVSLAVAAVNSRPVLARRDALAIVLDDAELASDERARLATGVLAHTLSEVVRDPAQVEAQRQVRYLAAATLVTVPYPEATSSLVRHFNTTFADYDRGLTLKGWVLEAIAALGSAGTEPAAVRLAAFLELLNTYTERDRPYDTQVMLAVVTNLGRLGYGLAHDPLFHVTLLNYPQQVKDAARAAIQAVTQ